MVKFLPYTSLFVLGGQETQKKHVKNLGTTHRPNISQDLQSYTCCYRSRWCFNAPCTVFPAHTVECLFFLWGEGKGAYLAGSGHTYGSVLRDHSEHYFGVRRWCWEIKFRSTRYKARALPVFQFHTSYFSKFTCFSPSVIITVFYYF